MRVSSEKIVVEAAGDLEVKAGSTITMGAEALFNPGSTATATGSLGTAATIAAGTIVFDTTTDKLVMFNGATWETITSA